MYSLVITSGLGLDGLESLSEGASLLLAAQQQLAASGHALPIIQDAMAAAQATLTMAAKSKGKYCSGCVVWSRDE